MTIYPAYTRGRLQTSGIVRSPASRTSTRGVSRYKSGFIVAGKLCCHRIAIAIGNYHESHTRSGLKHHNTMKLLLLATSLASALLAVAATPVSRQAKPAAFFLAGDSTTAVNGGWGDGFLATLRNSAIGQNRGHSGATTASFVAGGDWGKVLNLVKSNKAKYDCYVTIQFGHNDQVITDPLLLSKSLTLLSLSSRY